MITVHEHTFDETLLKPGANVLDLGCRGFEFTDALHKLGCNLYPVDCDDLPGHSYYKCAIGHTEGFCEVIHTSDPLATYVKPSTDYNGTHMHTIESFSKEVGVTHWDLIKMDIEGSELSILWNIRHPIAKQISVEFHAHCRPVQTKEHLDQLIEHLSQWYTIYNAVWEKRHGCSENYWDVLLIAK